MIVPLLPLLLDSNKDINVVNDDDLSDTIVLCPWLVSQLSVVEINPTDDDDDDEDDDVNDDNDISTIVGIIVEKRC